MPLSQSQTSPLNDISTQLKAEFSSIQHDIASLAHALCQLQQERKQEQVAHRRRMEQLHRALIILQQRQQEEKKTGTEERSQMTRQLSLLRRCMDKLQQHVIDSMTARGRGGVEPLAAGNNSGLDNTTSPNAPHGAATNGAIDASSTPSITLNISSIAQLDAASSSLHHGAAADIGRSVNSGSDSESGSVDDLLQAHLEDTDINSWDGWSGWIGTRRRAQNIGKASTHHQEQEVVTNAFSSEQKQNDDETKHGMDEFPGPQQPPSAWKSVLASSQSIQMPPSNGSLMRDPHSRKGDRVSSSNATASSNARTLPSSYPAAPSDVSTDAPSSMLQHPPIYQHPSQLDELQDGDVAESPDEDEDEAEMEDDGSDGSWHGEADDDYQPSGKKKKRKRPISKTKRKQPAKRTRFNRPGAKNLFNKRVSADRGVVEAEENVNQTNETGAMSINQLSPSASTSDPAFEACPATTTRVDIDLTQMSQWSEKEQVSDEDKQEDEEEEEEGGDGDSTAGPISLSQQTYGIDFSLSEAACDIAIAYSQPTHSSSTANPPSIHQPLSTSSAPRGRGRTRGRTSSTVPVRILPFVASKPAPSTASQQEGVPLVGRSLRARRSVSYVEVDEPSEREIRMMEAKMIVGKAKPKKRNS